MRAGVRTGLAPVPRPPRIALFSGLDPAGFAGLAADVEAVHGLRGHPLPLATCTTAQNSHDYAGHRATETSWLREQWQQVAEDGPPDAVKVGLLPSDALSAQISQLVSRLDAPVVLDPILRTSSGAEVGYAEDLLPHWAREQVLVTPNLAEAQAHSGLELDGSAGMQAAAQWYLDCGFGAALVKGGHADDSLDGLSTDYLAASAQSFWLAGPRLPVRQPRGLGCRLSAALATAWATMRLGFPTGPYSLADAAVIARMLIHEALEVAYAQGTRGHHALRVQGWPRTFPALPRVYTSIDPLPGQLEFPDCGAEPLGLYPVVDRAAWLERLLPLGVSTIQLRIKDLDGESLRAEVATAVRLSQRHGTRLFVNDHWQLAIETGAYGVHLGQTDIHAEAALALHRAGLRLGMSTHSHYEMARAMSYGPSYLALGPIHATYSKPMPWQPQGLDSLGYWADLVDRPLVAIGGFDRERGKAAREATGVRNIAVLSAITRAADPEGETRAWLELLE